MPYVVVAAGVVTTVAGLMVSPRSVAPANTLMFTHWPAATDDVWFTTTGGIGGDVAVKESIGVGSGVLGPPMPADWAPGG